MLCIFKDRMEILKHFKKIIIKKYLFFVILDLCQGVIFQMRVDLH